MKAACFSDTHKTPIQFTLPEVEFGIFSGDCCLPGKREELVNFLIWFSQQPVKHKIFVPGNHDWFTQRNETQTIEYMKQYGIHYLRDSGIELEGYKFYGSPTQPFFCNWAWNFHFPEERAASFANIPSDLDVLITHCPPYGILDQVPRNFLGATVWESVGCKMLKQAVIRSKPRYHVFGHIHCSRGVERVFSWFDVKFGTTFVNAAICNEGYEMDGRPIIIDIDDNTVDPVFDPIQQTRIAEIDMVNFLKKPDDEEDVDVE
jgi:Icc-related predicted phosphoesterase